MNFSRAAGSASQLNLTLVRPRKESMPVTEEQLATILTQKLGREVTPDEVDEFLHEEIAYKDRFTMHDVLNCGRCRKEGELN